MATWSKFYAFTENLAEKVHNLGSDTLKVMLTNTAPSVSNTVKGDITEISAGNGYTAGGHAVTVTASAQTSGTYQLTADPLTITATGAIGPFRYTVLYNDTATNDELIAWSDVGSITMANTDTFTVTFDGTNGVLRLT